MAKRKNSKQYICPVEVNIVVKFINLEKVWKTNHFATFRSLRVAIVQMQLKLKNLGGNMSKKLQCQECGKAEYGEDLYNYDGEILEKI